jgi:ATP-dependent DNA ligase
MQPSNYREPFSDSGWLFEPKWDGYRAICYYNKISVRFISRRNNDLTKRFPELQSIQVRAESAIIDGEIVALDEQGTLLSGIEKDSSVMCCRFLRF